MVITRELLQKLTKKNSRGGCRCSVKKETGKNRKRVKAKTIIIRDIGLGQNNTFPRLKKRLKEGGGERWEGVFRRLGGTTLNRTEGDKKGCL